MIIGYLLLGMFAGLLGGLLGMGGGLIVVPGLLFLFHLMAFPSDVAMQMAAGTSLAIMLITTSRSLRGHLRHAVSVWPIYRQLWPGVIVGTLLGTLIAHALPSNWLSLIFALFVFVIAIRTLFIKTAYNQRVLPGWAGMSGIGLAVGLKSGMLGIGGGALTIPVLTYCNVNIRHAVAVSAAVGITVAVIGTVSFMIQGSSVANLPAWTIGYIDCPAWLLVGIGSFLSAPIGVSWSHRLPTEKLKRVFGIFLLLVAIQMVRHSLSG